MRNLVIEHYEQSDGRWDSEVYEHSDYVSSAYCFVCTIHNRQAEDLPTAQVFTKMLIKEEYDSYNIIKEVIHYV